MTTYAVSMIRAYGNEVHEIEDSRCNHRLRKTVSLLFHAGYEWRSRQHTGECPRNRDRLANVLYSHREGVVCTCGRDRHPGEWQEPAPSDEAINAAWTLACATIEEHAAVHHRAIAEARASRMQS